MEKTEETQEQYHDHRLTLSKRVDLESRHFLAQDGFWQVQEGRVVDGEVVIIIFQNPYSDSLDTVSRTDRDGWGGRDGKLTSVPKKGGGGEDTRGKQEEHGNKGRESTRLTIQKNLAEQRWLP